MPKVVDEQMRESTRRLIIRVAASEFARLGFDQANINTIAELAGIGKGTIYLYFENKRELFLAMLRHIAESHITTIQAALDLEGTFQLRLERLFRAFMLLAEQESDTFNVYMSALYGVNRAFQAEATNLLRRYLTIITQMVEEGQAKGEIPPQASEQAALVILSLSESYILSARVLGYSEAQIAAQAKIVAQQILHGLGSVP